MNSVDLLPERTVTARPLSMPIPPANPSMRKRPLEQASFQANGTFMWEAFIAMHDLDRFLWMNFIWNRRCRCSLVRDSGLADEQVRARLRETARYLDEILQLRGLGGIAAGHPGDAIMKKAELIGPSRRRLDAQMRRRESCSCKTQRDAQQHQGISDNCA